MSEKKFEVNLGDIPIFVYDHFEADVKMLSEYKIPYINLSVRHEDGVDKIDVSGNVYLKTQIKAMLISAMLQIDSYKNEDITKG